MATYLSRLKKHLAHHKRTQLGIVDNGLWVHNSQPYEHILPIDRRDHNILAPIRSQFWVYAEKRGLTSRLHRDFHHLTSSQALTFNLFFPFVGLPWSEPTVLLKAIGLPSKDIRDYAFEAVPDMEEGTNFDFCATFTDGTRLLVEVKLSEGAFGKCKADDLHKRKLKDLYHGRLVGKVASAALDAASFFAQYQLLRNVSHLRSGDTLVLLVPRENCRTYAQADQFIRDSLTDTARQSVQLIALEDLITAARDAAPGPLLARAIGLLAEKYIPPAAL